MEEAINKKFLNTHWTTQLKGIAIIFVMTGHLLLLHFAGAWGVSVFLILSGFGLVKSYNKNGLKGFIRKRLSKLWIPYFIVTCIWLFINTFYFKIVYSKKDILLALFGINFKCIFDLSMWYITFLISWYIVFYFVFLIIRNKYLNVLLLFVFAFLWYKYGLQIVPSNVGASRYSFCFPIGVAFGLLSDKIEQIPSKINIKVFNNIFIATLLMFLYIYIRTVTLLDQTIQVILIGLCIVSIFSVFSMLSFRSRILEFIGGISYEIYLFEYIFIEYYKFIFKLNINPWIRLGIYFIFVFTLAFIFNILYKLAGKGIKKVLSKIKAPQLSRQ